MTRGHSHARDSHGNVQQDPFYCMAFGALLPKDFYFSMQNPLRPDIRIVRFEDLKLNPEATFASMGEFLTLPVTESMYQTTWCGMARDGVNGERGRFAGFDPAPVHKPYSQYLSVFDKYRIELLLAKFMEYYGYKAKYYDGQKFSDQELLAMMQLPFLCESIQTIIPAERKRQSRNAGMNFIKFAVAIKQYPFSLGGSEEEFAPLPWLRPKEELLRQPIYTTRD